MTYVRDPYDTDEPPCFCAPQATDPLGATAEFCPAHGSDLAKPVPEPEDDEGGDAEGDHIVHHVRDPKGDEIAHG